MTPRRTSAEILADEARRLEADEARETEAETAPSLAEEEEAFAAWLETFAGREYIGLAQRTIPELDRMSRGMRGMMLLVGPPGAGKTALATQLGLDAVRANADACLVIVSLEMSRHEITARMMSRLSGIAWETLLAGPGESTEAREYLFRQLGKRIRVLDSSATMTSPAETIYRHVDALRTRTGATRAIVVCDYLQVLPVDLAHASTDLDADKRRIDEMIRLRDRLGASSNAVIAISEARKAGNGGGAWAASSMSDVMGSARIAYAADAIMLLRPAEIAMTAKTKRAQPPAERAADDGIAMSTLEIVKGRDGWTRGSIELEFRYRTSDFRSRGGYRL